MTRTRPPADQQVSLDLNAVDEHELVGIDAAGHLCSCGERNTSHADHVADMLLGATLAVAA